MLKIYSCHTPSHVPLYRDYFLATMPGSLESHATCLDIGGTGDFHSEGFLRSLQAKVGLVLDSIRANAGSAILWSDVDIVFTGDPAPLIAGLLASRPEVDVWFQKEAAVGPDDVNAGFALMRCNRAVEGLYRAALAEMQAHPDWNDQDAINHLLRTGNPVAWDYLPMEFAARSHGWPPAADIVLYHANCTPGADGVGRKIGQFADLRRYRACGAPYLLYMRLRKNLRRTVAAIGGR